MLASERWQSPVDCSCLESSRPARARGFEYLPLRWGPRPGQGTRTPASTQRASSSSVQTTPPTRTSSSKR